MTKPVVDRCNPALRVTDRQERIDGFNQAALDDATCLLIGAGGIGSEVGEGLVRKGVGALRVLDFDRTDLSNLNRALFFRCDIGKYKSLRLARNLARHATCRTRLEGYACSFQDALALSLDLKADVVVCGVDDAKTRVCVSEHFRKHATPVIFIAVDLAAEHGYVFVQEPSGPCFGCLFPKNLYGRKVPCQTPASKDILKVVAGLGLFAFDSLIMKRRRNWNFRNIHLAGFAPGAERWIERRHDCPLCGSASQAAEHSKR